jgi:hypothetical protein
VSPPAPPLDIGHGVTISFVHYDGGIVGLIEKHHNSRGEPCSGYVHFRRAPNPDGLPTWIVEQEDPLTLSPSILCNRCQHHGYVREGRWVVA